MKKNIMKIGALVLALVMVLAMSVTAFADGEATLSNGKVGVSGTALAQGVNITKEIVFVNSEETTVREPNITYEYTVEAITVNATSAPTVNDGNTTVTVKSGVINANTNAEHKATVSFSDTATVANVVSTGRADSKTFTLTFDANQFDNAGVYRYSVTESIASSSNTKTAVGIEEAATYASVRYLDVYVEWVNDTHTPTRIYGYVLFEDETNHGTTGSIDLSTTKSQGWVDTDSNASDTVHTDVDVYTTQNLYLHKTTTGAMADLNQLFTLTYTATIPSTVTANVKVDAAITGGGEITDQQTADTVGIYINSTNFAKNGGNIVTVKNGTVASFKGIPAGGAVTITEKNDSTDSYKVKAGTTSGGADLLTEASVTAGATSGATSSQNINAKVDVYFTNTLDAISPTGVALRFAPYLLMAAAAVVLLVVMSRRRKDTQDKSNSI